MPAIPPRKPQGKGVSIGNADLPAVPMRGFSRFGERQAGHRCVEWMGIHLQTPTMQQWSARPWILPNVNPPRNFQTGSVSGNFFARLMKEVRRC